MSESLSPSQARKLVLLSQRLPPARQAGRAVEASLAAIEHLGYVQIDTISVVERAHHHTFWNRNPRYVPSQLDQLVEDKRVFEYWSHAASYLPMRDYRFTLPRKQAIARGEMEHWYERDEGLMKSVRDRIAAEGPLMAQDFEHVGRKTAEWHAKPAKKALENLYMQGDLMAVRRVNFHKVYELTERVLPEGIDTRVPGPEEHARFLIRRYLQANGLGQAAEMAYLRPGAKPLVSAVLQDMVGNGEVLPIRVGDSDWFALPESLELLDKPLARRKAKILSPFDNLVIQRKRMQALFGFDYQIECYVPAAKRRFGYFSLPILWDGKLVARMDCKVERKAGVLHVRHLALESGLKSVDAFLAALGQELEGFMTFNGCRDLRVHRTSPSSVKQEWKGVMGGWA